MRLVTVFHYLFFLHRLALLSGMEIFIDPDSSLNGVGTKESPFVEISSALEYSRNANNNNTIVIINIVGEPKFYLNCSGGVHNISGVGKGAIFRTTSPFEKKSVLNLNPFFVSNYADLEFENMNIYLDKDGFFNQCPLITLENKGKGVFKVIYILY